MANEFKRITSNIGVLRSTTSQLLGIDLYNSNAATRYLKLFNKRGLPILGTDIPTHTIVLLPTSNKPNPIDTPVDFGNGMSYAVTTGVADSDTNLGSVSDVVGSLVLSKADSATDKQVATRCYVPADLAISYKQSLSRSAHISRENLSSLKLVFAGFYVKQTGSSYGGNAGVNSKITASIEYPAGVFTQVLFNGDKTGGIPDNGLVTSDSVAVSIPDGEQFWVRTFITSDGGMVYHSKANTVDGDAWTNSTSNTLIDLTMTGTIPHTGGGNGYCPVAIIGNTTKPSYLLIGDSRTNGNQDLVNTTHGDTGEIARGIGPTNAYINAGVGGDLAFYFNQANNAATRVLLAQFCSHVIIQHTINDVTGGRTAIQVQNDLIAMAKKFSGKVLGLSTTAPVTTSSDSWATTGNQTVAPTNAIRIAINNWKRAVPAPFSFVFEVADAVESARDSGLWKAPSYTGDGIHETGTGYQAAGLVVKADAMPA